ncbi:MAG: glycosyltransferase family 61 protein [Alphaproteobacteria bacterium]|nr:glycosyltransferase family 61 protein [Alphaproteobacteria bacterium]
MGPHGAGLTNIVFSDCPERLIELFNSSQQSFYGRLAKALDIQYIGIEGAAAAPSPDEHMWDDAPFRVDVAQVRKALREPPGG